MKFVIKSDMVPRGDQPKAIEQLSQGILEGKKSQTLLGITGSGKTFTMANVIERVQRPTLVLAPKTLAAQLCSEFREIFRTMRWNILSAITIIISRRLMSLPATLY